MRISDWSSDVCSSDLNSFAVRRIIDLQCGLSKVHLTPVLEANSLAVLRSFARNAGGITLLSQMSIYSELKHGELDRKRVVSGKSVSVRVDLGGRRIIKKKTIDTNKYHIHSV